MANNPSHKVECVCGVASLLCTTIFTTANGVLVAVQWGLFGSGFAC